VNNAADNYQKVLREVKVTINGEPQLPVVERILSSANDKLQEIVEAATEKIYGREKGTLEKATIAVSEAYDAATSKVSKTVYGREAGAFESAISMISEIAKSASAEVSIAIYGTPKGPIEKATSAIAENMQAAAGVATEKYQAAKSAAVEALYGKEEEQYYARIIEPALARLRSAVEIATAKLTEVYAKSNATVREKAGDMAEGTKAATSAATEIVDTATEKVKKQYHRLERDEL